MNADAGVQQLESILQRLLELARLDAEAVEADSSDPILARKLKKPGYGLGLSIVNAIALRHGGVLELLESKGGGLEARLVLPVAVDSTAP